MQLSGREFDDTRSFFFFFFFSFDLWLLCSFLYALDAVIMWFGSLCSCNHVE